MMANKLQFGAMGDYPLVVNGFTFQSNPESKSRLIAVAAYNQFGVGQRPRGAQGLAVLRALRPQGQAGQRAVRLGRARHDAQGACRIAAGRRITSSSCQPDARGRLDQSAGEEDRRARRLRAVRRTAAVPRLRPQDLRRRRDQPADLARRRRAHRLRREISRGRGRLHQGDRGGERVVPRRSEARLGEDPGVDRHQQGSRLHLPRTGRQHDHRPDHQADPDRRRRAGRARSCRTSTA